MQAVELPFLLFIHSFIYYGFLSISISNSHLFAARFLTIEGIKYLREYLNLPSDTNIVPATHKRSTRPERRPPPGGRFGDEGGAREGGYREGYRAGPREGAPGLDSEKVSGCTCPRAKWVRGLHWQGRKEFVQFCEKKRNEQKERITGLWGVG